MQLRDLRQFTDLKRDAISDAQMGATEMHCVSISQNIATAILSGHETASTIRSAMENVTREQGANMYEVACKVFTIKHCLKTISSMPDKILIRAFARRLSIVLKRSQVTEMCKRNGNYKTRTIRFGPGI